MEPLAKMSLSKIKKIKACKENKIQCYKARRSIFQYWSLVFFCIYEKFGGFVMNIITKLENAHTAMITVKTYREMIADINGIYGQGVGEILFLM